MTNPTYSDGTKVNVGDRIIAYDIDGSQVFGTVAYDEDSMFQWYAIFDDGKEYAILDFNYIYKPENQLNQNYTDEKTII